MLQALVQRWTRPRTMARHTMVVVDHGALCWLDLAVRSFRAAAGGPTEVLQVLLVQVRADVHKARRPVCHTPASVAAQKGCAAVLHLLARAKAYPVLTVAGFGRDPWRRRRAQAPLGAGWLLAPTGCVCRRVLPMNLPPTCL